MSGRETSLPAAVLDCGVVLVFPDAHLRPSMGELMPCLRHHFCTVVGHEPVQEQTGRRPAARRSTRTRKPRLPRRTLDELRAQLTATPVTTTRALLARRFTLRLVVQAEAAGLLHADLVSGSVTARSDSPEHGGLL